MKTYFYYAEDKWCPLFGALPTLDQRDGISEKTIEIIADARSFFGGFEYFGGVENPDPARIEKNTGYPATWIEAIRFLVHVCSAHDILLSAQHSQGMFRNGAGWVEGRHEPMLSIDVDQLDPFILMRNIQNRAGLPHEFSTAFAHKEKYYMLSDEDHMITPAMTFALMALSVAWRLLQETSTDKQLSDSKEALSDLLTAEKLLKAAHAWQSNGLASRLDRKVNSEIIKDQENKKKHAVRTALSTKGKREGKEKRKEKVKKSFEKLFAGSNTQFLSINRIANEIHLDISPEPGDVGKDSISINTVKSCLKELDKEREIRLPQKKLKNNV